MDNCIFQEEKLYKYNIKRYFNQLKGNNLLGEEERKISNVILQELNKICKICSVSRVFKPSEIYIGNGELALGDEKIHAKLFEQNSFHDIMSILVFLITINETEDRVAIDRKRERSSDLLKQYYETSWKYAALQGYRDHMIEEYKSKEMQAGKRSFTPVIGPGYFGIDLQDSSKIYKLLNGKELGVILSDGMQFIPDNTICGFVISMESISKGCKRMFDNPCQYCLSVKKACGYCSYSNN